MRAQADDGDRNRAGWSCRYGVCGRPSSSALRTMTGPALAAHRFSCLRRAMARRFLRAGMAVRLMLTPNLPLPMVRRYAMALLVAGLRVFPAVFDGARDAHA